MPNVCVFMYVFSCCFVNFFYYFFDVLFPAGMCWLQQGPDHRCDMVLMREVSREECCSGGRLDTAWSNTSLPLNEVSLLGFLGIVSCKPCKGKLIHCYTLNLSLKRKKVIFT
uniref:Follistatin-like 3 (secreted glycoprotein) n=1 Tax=Fundulus heteroclitus TaxID=8078 RepID=A0A3Q2R047_FUNHE